MPPIRLLTFSTLYPNAARPNHGVFVENRLRQLLASGEAVSTVLAPIPYFPSSAPCFGEWARYAAAPAAETRNGIEVLHPRYLAIPKIGMSVAPFLLYRAMIPVLRRLLASGRRFDAIDAHYFYPDGVAAVWLGRYFRLPVVVTARGSDVTQLPEFRIPHRLICGAVAGSSAMITVSSALKDTLMELGAPAEKVTVLRNGVDTALFSPPADREALRRSLGLTRRTLISVGLLIDRKGHHRTIEAMAQLPEYELIIAGEGPERDRLAAQIARLGLTDRVRLLGARPHAELPALYGAADASVLASSREGWANVLLESMACGTPVVASNIPGNPEVVRTRDAGLIVAENTPEGIAVGVRSLFDPLPARAATRAYAEPFSWDETTQGQLRLFRRVIARATPAGASSGTPPSPL
ncbi:MAG: glycosyltransferase family 4 protein [Rhodospirillales bacterium]